MVEVAGVKQCRVKYATREDITRFQCSGCIDSCVSWDTPPTMHDWVQHFLHRHREALREAHLVLIERQPPCGFRCCEQLIFGATRHKARLLCPRSLHAFFNVGSLEYDLRKQRMVQLARHYYSYGVALKALEAESPRHCRRNVDGNPLLLYRRNQG